ncbi:protein wings apart-like [Drosophila elegans]|uniref:protein wings apart-like n=1 Tax=Drosophila elegans TaxID=30023 RepID=UPI0007E74001|nr:protein wings apart-like [Drosophila elegans]
MSRWGKNIVVPLDSLCKEKENTNRPTVARSVGTVGKWGKMGFTSTRTYTLSALHPMAAAAAAAAAAASPSQSPASTQDHDPNDLSVSVPEPPKPKKFFKSRNTAPPEVIAQIIQQLPHCGAGASPMRDQYSGGGGATPTSGAQEAGGLKLKPGKGGSSAERKRKSPKKKAAAAAAAQGGGTAATTTPSTPGAFYGASDRDGEGLSDPASEQPEQPSSASGKQNKKEKKPKEEKKLKPEAPPSRVLGRARKAVNYCEVDEDERYPTPTKDLIIPKPTRQPAEVAATATAAAATSLSEAFISSTFGSPGSEPSLPPPTSAPSTSASSTTTQLPFASGGASNPPSASRTPEHPPIVLRISKGTSRLVSTDSEEPPSSSPAAHQNQHNLLPVTDEEPADRTGDETVPASTPKITVKPLRPPPPSAADSVETSSATGGGGGAAGDSFEERKSLDPNQEDEEDEEEEDEEEEPPEINYCTVKISPDKPPKERLKLIIKTDVIRNAIAKAAAAAESRSEKKSKSKKHKHKQLLAAAGPAPAVAAPASAPGANPAEPNSEFKTPSPHLAFSEQANNSQQAQQHPPSNQQHHQLHPQRGSAVISPTTRSDHDFDSQSSVLGSISSKGNSTPQLLAQAVQEDSCVIRSRGSSVITSDLETSQHSSLVAPPSDIESRLESMMMTIDGAGTGAAAVVVPETPLQEDILAVLRGEVPRLNGNTDPEPNEEADQQQQQPKRATRGRGRKANNNVEVPPPATETRTRGRAKGADAAAAAISPPTPKRSTRGTRGSRKTAEQDVDMEVDEPAAAAPTNEEQLEQAPVAPPPRRGRNAAARANNNNSASVNNNINKIAANLSAKAEASRLMEGGAAGGAPRSYGRKRKNQQVTQVLQQQEQTQAPEEEETPEGNEEEQPTPAKIPHTDHSEHSPDHDPDPDPDELSNNSNNSSLQHDGSSSSPPPRDFKFKDKFKRTLTLDSQGSANAGAGGTAAAGAGAGAAEPSAAEQRGAVKLVISKKKGSIFKSRALVPSDQAEQASVAKRHLYKHSWDAALEANGGGTGSDASNASASGTGVAGAKDHLLLHHLAAGKSDGDFGDSPSSNNNGSSSACSSASTLRGDSPALVKISRQAGKQGVPATSASVDAFDLDLEPIAGELDVERSAAAAAFGGAGGGGATGGGGGGPTGGGGGPIRVDRKTKDYYTVVRNVKTAHQIQEIGEYQEMDDDVEYILDALQPHNPPATRCLSALQLAAKCMMPSFRMHVRAHGVVTKFFKALSDANKDLSLGLCTSAIMYILSQEGLNMDLDRDSLELMINLLEADGVGSGSTESGHPDRAGYDRNKQKVRELCEEIKAQGKGTHLNVDSLTVGTLAMETLLSLTSKRAGEWFKEDLRKLGGLEHIIKTISDFCRPVIACDTEIHWQPGLLDNMQTVARCLRVLENVTQHNEANQRYMLTSGQGKAVETLCQLYRLCSRQLMLHPSVDCTGSNKEHPGVAMRELLVPVLKVLINLTHTFNEAQPSLGAELLGQRGDVVETSFRLLLLSANYIPDHCVFELSILVLTLLINLCMHTLPNRAALMQAAAPAEYVADNPPAQGTVSALQALLEYFYKCEELARLVEKNTDAFLESNEKGKKKQEEVEETVNNLLQRAGHHMEHTLKGSYAAILVGNLIAENELYETLVRRQLRGNSFKEIIGVLEKYHTFMNLTSSLEAAFVAHMKSTKRIIDNFKKRDYIYEHSDDHDNTLPLNLETTAQVLAVETDTVSHAAASSSSTSVSASSSTSPTGSTRVTRVYKTYSSHR